jgi:predicted amidohydrolase
VGLLPLAVAQFAPVFRDPPANAAKLLDLFRRAVGGGAKLVVFPECALTGYCFSSAEEAAEAALPQDAPELQALERACSELDAYAVVGFAEKADGTLYNSAAFLGPDGRVGVYRKTHLPLLGFDRFVTRGAELPVYETPIGRFGILICYDLRVPEAALSLAKRGAEAILVPTNWPTGAESSPDLLAPARAWDTRTFIAAANRVGSEGGFDFIGKSGIWDVDARPLAYAGHTDEAILHAEVDLSLAREKRIVVRKGEFELDPLNDRRPELYELGPGA